MKPVNIIALTHAVNILNTAEYDTFSCKSWHYYNILGHIKVGARFSKSFKFKEFHGNSNQLS